MSSHAALLALGGTPACAGTTRWLSTPWPWAWDHPRVRGDHSSHLITVMRWDEWSPRTRGPRDQVACVDPELGSTPACAGATRIPPGTCSPAREHPRVRGDHSDERIGPAGGDAPSGTTPACAGTTKSRKRVVFVRRDHPRVRGDHLPRGCSSPPPAGPPPRARGPRHHPPRPGSPPGTTPACAGTTGDACHHGAHDQDHPRVRGDHRPHHQVVATRRGTTPACAGTTDRSKQTSSWVRDHPRVRGDHSEGVTRGSPAGGPPPRARGPPGPARRIRRRPGTTPACAGTTSTGATPRCRSRDHPRVRGDHSEFRISETSASGPPLRARGPPPPRWMTHVTHGTTPACAGTTSP